MEPALGPEETVDELEPCEPELVLLPAARMPEKDAAGSKTLPKWSSRRSVDDGTKNASEST